MKVRFVLNPDRDIELIALRLCGFLDFNAIAKSAIKAYVRGIEYQVTIPVTDEFVERPLRCAITFSDKDDADVIKFIQSLKCSKTNAIKNIILMCVRGRPQATYQNESLNRLLLEMTVARAVTEPVKTIEEETDEASYWKAVADSMGNF